MCPEKLVNVFVYGTLKVGGKLHLGEELAAVEDEVKGTLYGKGLSFPMAKLDNSDNTIKGEVHIYPHRTLDLLDMIESEGYLYRRVEVVTEGGRPCYIYEFIHSVEGLEVCEDGVWEDPQ